MAFEWLRESSKLQGSVSESRERQLKEEFLDRKAPGSRAANFFYPLLTSSRTQPSPDGPPGLRVVANHAQGRGNRNRQNQSHAAPHPAPEKQRYRNGHGI